MRFEKPPEGSVISVTTEFPEVLLFATNKYRHNQYNNVTVLRSDRWFSDTQFKISSDDPKVPERVVDLNNVIDLRDSNGQAYQTEEKSGNFSIQVEGSKQQQYTVTFSNGQAVSCTCTGFTFRNYCKHLKQAAKNVDLG